MLQIRMMKFEDTEKSRPLFQEDPNYFNKQQLIIDQTFIIDQSNEIIGVGSYKRKGDNAAIVDLLYVKKANRGQKLGDGLLRALLNHLNIKGYHTVFFNSEGASNGFFVSEGLEIAAVDPQNAEILTFRAELPNFFEGGCKHSGRQA